MWAWFTVVRDGEEVNLHVDATVEDDPETNYQGVEILELTTGGKRWDGELTDEEEQALTKQIWAMAQEDD